MGFEETVSSHTRGITMYERMLDKKAPPGTGAIREWLGNESSGRLDEMTRRMEASYQLVREPKFPFGDKYGWGYKYSHKTSHLCYAFFEKGAFTVTLQLGDKLVPMVEAALPSLSPNTQKLWENRYPCGESGGWVHCRILSNNDLEDVIRLLHIRKKPK
jgi:hypothetical protein